MKDLIGKWAFVAGVVIAVLVGLFAGAISENIAIVLMVLGLIVGLLNITAKEATPFLLAGVSVIIATSFGKATITGIAANVLTAIMILVIPAVIIVALREVFSMAKAK